MQSSNINCQLCETDNARLLITITADDNRFRLVECNTCGLAYINPQPTELDLADLYSSIYEEREGDFWSKYIAASRDLYEQVYAVIQTRRPSATELLDYGCGLGGLLQFMSDRGLDTFGVDYSSRAVRYVKDQFGLKAEQAPTPADLPKEAFDVVTLLDVLEHSPDPYLMLSGLYQTLREDGVIIVRVPNFNFGRLQILASKFGTASVRHSIQLTPPGHLYYFTPETLSVTLDKVGFRHISVVPARDVTFGPNKLRSSLKLLYTSQAKILYHLSHHKIVLNPAILAHAVR